MQKHLRNYPRRGEIFIADLDPGFGREIRKKRPVVVISANTLNQVSPTVIIVPLSSIVPEFIGPEFVKIEKNEGLNKQSVIIVNEIRSIDKERLIKKIGNVSQEKLAEVEKALQIVLGMIKLD